MHGFVLQDGAVENVHVGEVHPGQVGGIVDHMERTVLVQVARPGSKAGCGIEGNECAHTLRAQPRALIPDSLDFSGWPKQLVLLTGVSHEASV